MRQFPKLLVALLLTLSLTQAGWTQDDTAVPDASDSETPAVEDPAEDDDADVQATDDESYLDIEEEDFTPSEEIGADQSIAFPTDI